MHAGLITRYSRKVRRPFADGEFGQRLLQFGHAGVSRLRFKQVKRLKFRQSVQMDKPTVRHLRARQDKSMELRQTLQMHEPRVRHLRVRQPKELKL